MIAADDDLLRGEHEEQEQQQQQQQQVAPLQNYFTLPFALHLRPLPHVSFLAQEDSQESSEAEENNSASTSSHESNYRAGRHRLHPVVQSISPHPLSTISTLLDQTGCLEAVPIWAELIALLDKADEDVHFTHLRQFFDARFDNDGRLISDKTKGETLSDDEKESNGLWGSTGIFRRRASSSTKNSLRNQQSPLLGAEEARRESNASRSSSRPFATRSKSQLGKAVYSDDQQALDEQDEKASSVGGEEVRSQPNNRSPSYLDRGQSQRRKLRALNIQNAIRAPEINISRHVSQGSHSNNSRNRASSVRPVRFKIRLDLHSVHLAPRPPRAPSSAYQTSSPIRTKSKRGFVKSQHSRAGSSPEKGLEIYRATSGQSLTDGVPLFPVKSPGSARSQQLSEESHSEENHNGSIRLGTMQSDSLSTSPQRRGTDLSKQSSMSRRSQRGKSMGRSMTGSSAATNLTSLFGSSPEGGEERLTNDTSSTTKEDGKRRPSIIQRLMNLNSRKGSFGRARSMTNSTNLSNTSMDEVQSKSEHVESDPRSISGDQDLPTSPIDGAQSRSFSMVMHAQDATDRRPLIASDWSNEEALDVADDDGSVTSSSGWGRVASGRRKSSSGVLPSNNAVGLRPVDEEKAFDSASAFSGNYREEDNIREENEDEAEWSENRDFLTLLRSAANVTLHLKKGPKDGSNLATPKSPASMNELRSPAGSIQMEEKLLAEELLAPFRKKGHEENPDSWWLCGKADPLPISFSCALSQALGWQGIMQLCYGKESKCDKSGTFSSLGRAAELYGKLQNDSDKVRNWAQAVSQSSLSQEASGTSHLEKGAEDAVLENQTISSNVDEIAPSESASIGRSASKKDRVAKLPRWVSRIPGRTATAATSEEVDILAPTDGNLPALVQERDPNLNQEGRTWQDWADLLASIASWMEEYEICRVRSGMAREIDCEPSRSTKGPVEQHIDSGFAGMTNYDQKKIKLDESVIYSSLASYQVPRCVILDAIDSDNGFRRRHGIPEGLPVGPDGEEVGDYRWARSKLSSSHFATPLLLASGSLSYYYGQLATSDWTYDSSWELDYLEMCVFHSDIISTRFPSPNTSIVPFEQVYQPGIGDVEGIKRAKTCPYPRDSAWLAGDWKQWLISVKNGMILVPAVSWQAWWTLIAVLNGADGSGRPLDLQVKAAEEAFSALDDLNCIYI